MGFIAASRAWAKRIKLAVQAIPEDVLQECRARADAWIAEGRTRPRSMAGAVAIVLLWIGSGAALTWCWHRA